MGPVAPGSKRVGPGLLTIVWSPTLVLRMRNRAGAPETRALTSTVIGKIAVGSASSPGTACHVVDDVDTAEVRHTVSMQSTGVRPVVVPAITPRAPTATRAEGDRRHEQVPAHRGRLLSARSGPRLGRPRVRDDLEEGEAPVDPVRYEAWAAR